MSYDALHLNKQLCHRLYIASNSITRAYRLLLDELSITYPQFVVLMALWEKDNVSANELAAMTKFDSGALTRLISTLSTNQIVNLKQGKNDKRQKFIILTQKGIKLREQAKDIPEKISCNFPSFSPDQARSLYQLLDLAISDLEESHQGT